MNVKLGENYRDKITGYEGVAVGETQWLYGCRRITIQSPELKDGVPVDSRTFDEPQLEKVKAEPIKRTKKDTMRGGPRPEPTRRPDPVRG